MEIEFTYLSHKITDEKDVSVNVRVTNQTEKTPSFTDLTAELYMSDDEEGPWIFVAKTETTTEKLAIQDLKPHAVKDIVLTFSPKKEVTVPYVMLTFQY